MAAASAISGMYTAVPRGQRAAACFTGTPEVYFAKAIDNSRLVRVADPQRKREMGMFSIALVALFAVVMLYAWQHFSAIQYGYKIEAQKGVRDSLVEENRALRLEEASLRDPERIDTLAREMGFNSPQTGQVVRMDAGSVDSGVPMMAQATPIAVVPAQ